MPTPITATQGSQSENANAPAATPDKQTTTQPRAQESNLMDFLDVPAEVQAQIKPKTVEPMTGDIPAEHPKGTEETPAEPQQPESQQQAEPPSQPTKPAAVLDDDDDDDDDDDITGQNNDGAAAESQGPDNRVIRKLQKRINRLTRQKSERDSQIDTLFQQVTDLKGKAEKQNGDADKAAVPSAGGWLPNVTNERQLDQEVSKARDLVEWCNENAEGVTSGEGDNQKFVSPKEIAGWKTRAEMVLIGAEPRRRELREFSSNRDKYDVLAKQAWPELFDNSTEEYQLGQSLLEANPELKLRVDRNYALGLLLEGVKSLHGRVQAAAKQVAANGNGNAVRTGRRDIDPRAFEARVPLAPGGPEAPTREVVPSSHKKLNEAMTQLVADPDGSVSSLANALGALDEMKRTRAGSRTPVKV